MVTYGIHNMSSNQEKISSCGYKLVNQFLLPEDAWWTEYYGPLEIRLKELRRKYQNDLEAQKIIQKHQDEVDMVKANPKKFGSIFYILQKITKIGKK